MGDSIIQEHESLETFNAGLPVPSEKEFLERVKAGDLPGVRSALEVDPSRIEAKDENGISAILIAAYHGHQALADLLLSRHPSLDLFEASAFGRLERAKELIAKEPVSVHRFSPDGFSPLHLAAFFGHPDVVSYLVAHGAGVDAVSRNPMRVRPLHSALAHRDAAAAFKIAGILLSHGAEVNAAQAGGWTPLHQAATHGLADLAALLLAHGADAAAKAENGKSPIDMAAKSGKKAVLDLLRKANRAQGA